MSKAIKALRGQVRQIVQDLLPEIIKTEFVADLHRKVAEQVDKRLDNLMAYNRAALETIDKRSKDVEAYVVRETARSAPKATEEVVIPGTEGQQQ